MHKMCNCRRDPVPQNQLLLVQRVTPKTVHKWIIAQLYKVIQFDSHSLCQSIKIQLKTTRRRNIPRSDNTKRPCQVQHLAGPARRAPLGQPDIGNKKMFERVLIKVKLGVNIARLSAATKASSKRILSAPCFLVCLLKSCMIGWG